MSEKKAIFVGGEGTGSIRREKLFWDAERRSPRQTGRS